MTLVCWTNKAKLWLQNKQELTLVHYGIVEQKHTMLSPLADALVRPTYVLPADHPWQPGLSVPVAGRQAGSIIDTGITEPLQLR